MSNLLKQLKEQGFDKSYDLTEVKGSMAGCSQCQALVINGTATHERGCPNACEGREGDEP